MVMVCGACSAQGVFEAHLTGSISGSEAAFVAGVGYFRVTGTTVDYHLAILGYASGSLSPVFSTATFETVFTTGPGEVIVSSGCAMYPPNPFLPIPGPEGPYTCPAQRAWADYWGRFDLPQGQVDELFASGGVLRLPSGSEIQIQGPIAPVPEPTTAVLVLTGLAAAVFRTARRRPGKPSAALAAPSTVIREPALGS